MASYDLIGSSAKFRAVLDQINMVAPVDSAVLIHGETGTGKEVIAQAIHEASLRRWNRFVGAVATAMGRFQAADRGTLFLDEIGDLPLELQSKLLRALQEKQFERLGGNHTVQVNVRVI